MYWYVLFVLTGYEQRVANEITHTWPIDGIKPFVPMYDARFRRAGKVILEKRRWTPGYVLVESPQKGLDFYLSIKPFIARSEYTLRMLRNGAIHLDESFEMDSREYALLQKLMNNEQCVEMSKGLIEGAKVIVTDGPLLGHEGLIKKINRHKMEATIHANFMGSLRELTVGLEIIQKTP